jgi:hypothetical protein
MPALVEYQDDRIKGVLRKKLSSTDDHCHETNRVSQVGGKFVPSSSAEGRPDRSYPEPRESHCDSSGEPGKRELGPRAPEF